MTAPTDRRVQRTKAAIRNAFVALIEEKGFDALTVSDIAARADVNRGTFYLHYADKFDLLEKTQGEIISDVEAIAQPGHWLHVEPVRDMEEVLPSVVTFFQYLCDNAALVSAVLGLKGDVAFEARLKKAIERNLVSAGFFDQVKEADLLVPVEHFINYVLSANLGVIQAWLRTDCRESPQEMALILLRLTFGGPLSAIGGGRSADRAAGL